MPFHSLGPGFDHGRSKWHSVLCLYGIMFNYLVSESNKLIKQWRLICYLKADNESSYKKFYRGWKRNGKRPFSKQ